MRYFKKVIVLVFLFIQIQFSQSDPDPFQGNYNLGSSAEIAIFWHYDASNDSTVKHQIIDYYGTSGQYFLDSSARGTYSGNLGTGYDNGFARFYFDAITGDYDGDGLDEIVSAWETTDNSINILIPEIDKGTLSWDNEKVLKLSNVLYSNPTNNDAFRFRLIKGFFDGDPDPEFALAFWNPDENIEIRVYDVNPNTLMPEEKASIKDEYMDPSLNNSGLYDIAAGDFDGDLRDEIVLVAYEEINDNTWSMYTKVYDYVEDNGSFSFIPKARENNFYTSNDFFDPDYRINNLAVAAGDFTNNTLDEFVVDFVLYDSDNARNYLLPASISLNLDTINVDLNNFESVFQTNGKSSLGIGVITADINNDGKDEIVIDGDGRIRIYDIDTTLQLLGYIGNNKSTESSSRRRMTLADLDASTTDSVWNPEIIVSSTTEYQPDNIPHYKTLQVDVFEPIVDPSGDIISLQNRTSLKVDSIVGGSSYYWAVTAGDFDGGGIRLGTPNYYRATDIVQPLVILNAPPTHFDVIDGTAYDVNQSYNGQSSDFFSKYFTSSETEIDVETEIHSDWVLGGSVSGGFTIPGLKIGVEAKIEGEYGQGFSKRESSKDIYRVSQNITATNDDYVYATVVNYDIWEYPIIANDTIQGYTLVLSPGLKTRSWFPSKSPQAEQYLPDHEVGNILSYNQVSAPEDNSAFDVGVKWNTSDEFTLGANSSFNWTLENENSTETTITNTEDWSIGASLSFNIPFPYIPNFEFHGNYSQGSVSTRSNKVTYSKGLEVNLSSIDLSIGETYYSVIPYAYWAKNGALVLDYAVNPNASPPGVPQTWFQENYSNKPDPSLILPWRLDPEKGFTIPEDKRYQTKEIIFNPDEPKPGETINIQTRIHNYSFLNTSGTVSARFYLGDPDDGGTLIESTDGKTIFSTDDFIPARGSKLISFDWTLPESTPYFPRIYVVVDPDNAIDEIHETNNKGWKVLNYKEGTTGIEDKNSTISLYELSQNYPNPFNPTTNFEFRIAESGFVSLKIFDVLGRKVKTLVYEEKSPGQYEITFDASGFASGVYFYRLEAGDFISTKKMILLR
jgi:hypothetical protein